ncbi:CCHC-type domain-containing protein [Durusdinium trenchii]|uniref:CCHC-type domain-containing protein n=1 Tax=Durusdinium trenchii TaxID=1381693 RepID=A0ABP0JDU7_9DINO
MPDLLAAGLPLPVEAQSARQQADGAGSDSGWNQNDPFSRTDKWIGNPPQPSFEKWRDRESEVLNWAQYVADLSAWASQASLQFGTEILQASRWSTPIRWSSMTLVMRSRSMRLLAILRSTFMGHPRSATLIHAFMEGVDIQAMTSDGSAGTSANGYELLRQLTQEYSLRTRNEALVFRTALASKSFVLTAQETSPSSLVSDTVRRIELEAARYQRLLSTLPSTVDAVGLQVSEADLLMVLVRSLPETVRNYVLRHAEGESYQAYRSAACRWEQQQRMFTDLVPLGGKKEDWHSGWVETSRDGYGAGGELGSETQYRTDVAYFAGCPWVRLHPVETLDRNTDEAEVSGSQQLSLSAIAGVPELTVSEKGYELPVYPLSRAAARELEQHRAQGHTPFHPGCVECARGRSVFSHRRRSQERLQCEIQADFCYLKSQGEILEDDQGLGNIKILVLTELVSNAVGYIVVTSDLKAVKKRISKWMELFGLASTSGATSVVLHTDAEQAVGDLISDCSEKISFLVRKANPQQHRSVGAAERAVRRLKESLGVLRADLNKSGVDLNFTPDSVAEALTYLALVHNHFGKTPSSDFSPLETVCGRLKIFMCREERWAAFDAQENLQNLPVPLEAEYTRQFKRAADTAVQDLEETVLGVGMLMVYVDDILLCTSTEQAERSVINAISAVVPTKAVAFSHFVHRVLFGLGEIDEKEQVDIVLESDSSSALQLIGAVDLPRRSRHIDIKLTWLKERVSSNEVQLRHRAGTQNVADLFTKCAWSEADEKALQVMLARRSQGIVPPCVTQTAGSMTDAAKRRLVDFESDEFEEVPFPGSPKDRVATLAAMDVTIADEGKVKHLLPKGVDSFVEWSRTVIAFGKLKDSGLSYKEIVADPKHEAYVAWCKRLKGSTGPAGDFGDFLQAYEMIFDGRLGDGGYYSESTVRRVLK